MKLPRWVVVSLWSISTLSVLASTGWWWVTWPDRTAQGLVEELTKDDDDLSGEYLDERGNRILIFGKPTDWSDVKSQPRSVEDFVFARRRYKVCDSPRAWWQFMVQRGAVLGPGDDDLFGVD